MIDSELHVRGLGTRSKSLALKNKWLTCRKLHFLLGLHGILFAGQMHWGRCLLPALGMSWLFCIFNSPVA